MNITKLEKNWNRFGQIDPMWAILSINGTKGNKWNIDKFFNSGKHEIDTVMKQIKSLGLNIQNETALDFGCGIGRLTQALAIYFNKVSGVDIAESMIDQANKHNQQGEKCKFYQNNTDNLSIFHNSSFDFIYTNITLQHIEPKYSKKYISDFIRILKPNGLLVFQIPSERVAVDFKKRNIHTIIKSLLPIYIIRSIGQIKNFSTPIMEMHCISKEEITNLIEENDAKILFAIPYSGSGEEWHSFLYFVGKKY